MLALFGGEPLLVITALAYAACFLYFGVHLTLIDIAQHRLPNRLVAGWALASIPFLLAFSIHSGDWRALLFAVLGAALLGAAYLMMSLLGRGAMGMGDVKLAGVLGLNLGYFSLGSLLLATVLAFVTASLVVLTGVMLRKLSMKSMVPFGPFMILGALLALGMAP